MHFVIKLLMLQNPVLVKYICNYINQLACNCILLFLIPKTLLGIFEKLVFPGSGSWGGRDINTTLQKRLNRFKYNYTGKQNMIFSIQRSVIMGQNLCMTGHSVNNLRKDKNTTLQHLI